MILLTLFLAFFHIGALAFGGGYAVLPFLREVIVIQHQWLTNQEIIDIITISQMTPGPIAINAATFVGTKVVGLPGSIIATAGNVLPQFILMIFLSRLVFSNKKITFMENIIKGLKPGMVSLIFVATLTMIHNSILNGAEINFDFTKILNEVSLTALVTFVIGFILYKRKMDIIKIILISAVIGVALPLGFEAIGLNLV